MISLKNPMLTFGQINEHISYLSKNKIHAKILLFGGGAGRGLAGGGGGGGPPPKCPLWWPLSWSAQTARLLPQMSFLSLVANPVNLFSRVLLQFLSFLCKCLQPYTPSSTLCSAFDTLIPQIPWCWFPRIFCLQSISMEWLSPSSLTETLSRLVQV